MLRVLAGLEVLLSLCLVVLCAARTAVLELLVAIGLLSLSLVLLWRLREKSLVGDLDDRPQALEEGQAKVEQVKEVKETQTEDLEKLTQERRLLELRQEVADAGLREKRLQEALRSRSACLLRLASNLTRAQRDGCSAGVQTEEEAPAARLLDLAQGSAEVREMLLKRLRRGEEEVKKAPRAADAIARKLAEQAAELECLRESGRAASAEASRLRTELQAREDALRRSEEELRRKEVIHVSSASPDLRVRWVEEGLLPGQVGSLQGMKQLRQCLALRPAELRVGPPPGDWKVLLQLRLRHEGWHPALLELHSEESSFLGLLWPS